MIDLKGKAALVTGASRGIGRSIALTLARAGADVACVATNEGLLAEVKTEIEKLGRKALAIKCDVAKAADVERAVEDTVKTFGKLDILVNNAGIARDNLLLRMKEEDWDAVMNVNLKSAFLFIKAASRHMMRAKGGKIVNVSSVAGIMGNPGQANYTAAKAGMIGLTKTAAKEFASRNLCINCVAPGFIDTDMSRALSEQIREEAKKLIPLGRFGTADEIANAVLFLSSDLANYVTGHVLVVDGGMAM